MKSQTIHNNSCNISRRLLLTLAVCTESSWMLLTVCEGFSKPVLRCLVYSLHSLLQDLLLTQCRLRISFRLPRPVFESVLASGVRSDYRTKQKKVWMWNEPRLWLTDRLTDWLSVSTASSKTVRDNQWWTKHRQQFLSCRPTGWN